MPQAIQSNRGNVKEQLQAQRDIASGVNSDISHTYTSLSSVKWMFGCAYHKRNGVIIQVPSDYELPAETKDFVSQITSLDFEKRIDFLCVAP